MIEYVARQTKNRRRVVTRKLGEAGIRKQLYDAQVNHCLSFEQVGDEIIEHCSKPGEEVQELMKIFDSFISDEISDFQTDLYYQNPSYLEWSYKEGRLLD